MSDIRITAGNSIVAIDSWLKALAGNLTGSQVVGYRQTRVQFEDILSQTIQAGAPATVSPSRAAINPMQISAGGVAIKATRTDFSQGSMTSTQRMTDMAISGNGFFALSKVKNPTSMDQLVFTRNGSFTFELENDNSILNAADRAKLGPHSQLGVLRLVSQEGYFVVGTTGDYAPSNTAGVPGTPIAAPDGGKPGIMLGDLVSEPYRSASRTGDAAAGGLGLKSFAFPFIKDSNGNFGMNDDLLGQLAFNKNGMLLNANRQDCPTSSYQFESAGMVSLGNIPAANDLNQNLGVINNAENYNKYVAVMTFSTPDGLSRQSGTSFTWSRTAGPYFVGVAGTQRGPVGGTNEINPGSLETSNSNVNTTLPELTIAQKSFTANVKIVSVGNALVDDLNQLIK